MIKTSQILNTINQWAPFHTAASWDNVGLQIGDLHTPVSSVLLALEIDKATHHYIQENPVDMIITHHPLIFKPLSKICLSDDMGHILTTLLTQKIHLICAHTNLDIAPGGVNDCLVEAYGFDPQLGKPISVEFGKYFNNKQQLSIEALADKFPVRVTGDKQKKVSNKIGFCGGSGHGLVRECAVKNIDCLITGEVNYHDEVFCELNGITLLLMGHRESEVFWMPEMKKRLNAAHKGLKIESIL